MSFQTSPLVDSVHLLQCKETGSSSMCLSLTSNLWDQRKDKHTTFVDDYIGKRCFTVFARVK